MNNEKYQMLLNVIDKAENGPIVDENDWDKIYIGEKVQDLIKKYDINWNMDDQSFVSTDNDLADRTFEAGMEFAREVGVYCIDTNRQMKFSQKELEQSLAILPQEIVAGTGDDRVTIHKRKPEAGPGVSELALACQRCSGSSAILTPKPALNRISNAHRLALSIAGTASLSAWNSKLPVSATTSASAPNTAMAPAKA